MIYFLKAKVSLALGHFGRTWDISDQSHACLKEAESRAVQGCNSRRVSVCRLLRHSFCKGWVSATKPNGSQGPGRLVKQRNGIYSTTCIMIIIPSMEVPVSGTVLCIWHKLSPLRLKIATWGSAIISLELHVRKAVGWHCLLQSLA